MTYDDEVPQQPDDSIRSAQLWEPARWASIFAIATGAGLANVPDVARVPASRPVPGRLRLEEAELETSLPT